MLIGRDTCSLVTLLQPHPHIKDYWARAPYLSHAEIYEDIPNVFSCEAFLGRKLGARLYILLKLVTENRYLNVSWTEGSVVSRATYSPFAMLPILLQRICPILM